jgi:hypothetical protein
MFLSVNGTAESYGLDARLFTAAVGVPTMEEVRSFELAVARAATLVLLALVAAGVAGCMGTRATAAPHPCARQPEAAPPAARAGAASVATSYLTALATHHYEPAQTLVEACTGAQRRSLDRLWTWLAGMPIEAVKIGHPQVTDEHRAVSVRAMVYGRFGAPPASAWVRLGSRTLQLAWVRNGWRVRADVSQTSGSDLGVYGFTQLRHPFFVNGSRATVVYGSTSELVDAEHILDAAESAAPGLWQAYGGGTAGLRPLIFLVDNAAQGERLAHVDLGKVRTPAGFQYSSFAYVDLPEWRKLDSVHQQSMVVHELTHVVTRPMLDGAPHSLLEGIAMDEEARFLRVRGVPMSLEELYPYYYHDAFPSLRVWERRETDWGLGNVHAIGLCYLDALAMTHVIVTRHGGVDALRRLGVAFRAQHVRRDFTAAQVQAAFRRGLGVSFDRIAAEAHAYTRARIFTGA